MINFLRNLRRNNMKNSKYITYAIGEIVLVVIGILIALSINNWNENRKENKNEQLLLEKLQTEHGYNLDILTSDTSYIFGITESISAVYLNLKEQNEDSDSIIAERINDVLRITLFEFSTEYLDRYINTSKVTNDELVTEFIELKELYSSLDLSSKLTYDYKMNKIIGWVEESLDFYNAEIEDVNLLRNKVFINRLIILESIEYGRLENFKESIKKAMKVDSLLATRLSE